VGRSQRLVRLSAAVTAAVTLGACGHHVSKLGDTEARSRLTTLLQQTADSVDPGPAHRVSNPFRGLCEGFLGHEYAHNFDAHVDMTFPIDETAVHFFGRV